MTDDEVVMLMRRAGWALLRLDGGPIFPRLALQQLVTVGDPNTEYGYTPERPRWPAILPEDVRIMDEVMTWPSLIPDELGTVRRIVALRLLWDDIRQRHVWSWRRIADRIGSSHGHTKDLFAMGVSLIARSLTKKLVTCEKVVSKNAKWGAF